MDAILISMFIMSCYTVLKIGSRIYHVRCYLAKRACRVAKREGVHTSNVVRVDFRSGYQGVPARAG